MLLCHLFAFIILGDLNAKHTSWDCNKNNAAGNSLFTLQQSEQFMVFHTTEHTHYPHSGATPSSIDLMVTNAHNSFDLFAFPDQLSSDHSPIVCKVYGRKTLIEKAPKFIFKQANWNKYHDYINRHLSTNQLFDNTAEIDAEIEHISSVIKAAQQQCISVQQTRLNKINISQNTKSLIREKNMLKRQWQRCTNDRLKQQLKINLNQIQRQLAVQIKMENDNAWNKLLIQFQKGSKHIWNLAKKSKGNNKSPIEKIKVNSISVTDDKVKANLLANVFKQSHTITSNYNHPNDIVVKECIRANKLIAVNVNNNLSIHVDTVKSIIATRRPFKSPGPDGIQNILLKNLPLKAVQKITDIFNACIKLSYWPTNFKLAKVVPIQKSGKDPSSVTSYRPISLLNSIGKIFEKVIYGYLEQFAIANNIIPKYQFGFKKEHSTTHQIKRLTNHIIRNKKYKMSTGAILLDIEKAFDSVWHDGLIYKLIQLKFPAILWKLIIDNLWSMWAIALQTKLIYRLA